MGFANKPLIEGMPSSQSLLDSIDNSGHSVMLRECGAGEDLAWDKALGNPNLYNGKGADANV